MIDDYESADELAEAIEDQLTDLAAGIRAHDAALSKLITKLREFRGLDDNR